MPPFERLESFRHSRVKRRFSSNTNNQQKKPASQLRRSGSQQVLAADRFEAVAGSVEEDSVRRQALADHMPIVPPVGWTNISFAFRQATAFVPGRSLPRLDREAALALVRKLKPDADAKPPTLASAVSMRAIRVEVVGALLDALADLPDDQLCTVTIVKPSWVFSPEELMKVSARTIKRAFEQDLRRAGVADIKGPWVGFLHGEYANNVFVLHFHCTTTRRKAALVVRRLRRLKRTYRASVIVKRPIRISKMRNRVGQLTYLFKRFWPSRPILMIDGKERRCRHARRVPEPHSSLYLLWLDQQHLLDLTVTKGTWSKRNGGSLAWKRFYLIVAKWSRAMASRS